MATYQRGGCTTIPLFGGTVVTAPLHPADAPRTTSVQVLRNVGTAHLSIRLNSAGHTAATRASPTSTGLQHGSVSARGRICLAPTSREAAGSLAALTRFGATGRFKIFAGCAGNRVIGVIRWRFRRSASDNTQGNLLGRPEMHAVTLSQHLSIWPCLLDPFFQARDGPARRPLPIGSGSRLGFACDGDCPGNGCSRRDRAVD